MNSGLPAEFLFGTTAPVHELDSALDDPARSCSPWDVFAGLPGRIDDGTRPGDAGAVPPGTAAELLAAAGVGAHRLSASWSRLQPAGRGPLDTTALSHLDGQVEALLAAGVRPWLTVPAGSLPTTLMTGGGWLAPASVHRFAELTDRLAAVFVGRVDAWQPLSDMFSHLAYGYAAGVDAPGLTLLDAAFPVAHHLLLAHGRAVQTLRSAGASKIGIALDAHAVRAGSNHRVDRRAARLFDLYANRQFLEPLLRSRFPRSMAHPDQERKTAEDLEVISTPVDFLGLDYAGPVAVVAAPGNARVPFSLTGLPEHPKTDAGGPIIPAALTDLLLELTRQFPALPPIYLTGVGAPLADDGAAAEFVDEHLHAAAGAVAAGADVRGYFHRTGWDGWAGAAGLTHRTGLVEVDHATTALRIRPSYRRYAELIAAHHRICDGRASSSPSR